jgi:hypothetical protein
MSDMQGPAQARRARQARAVDGCLLTNSGWPWQQKTLPPTVYISTGVRAERAITAAPGGACRTCCPWDLYSRRLLRPPRSLLAGASSSISSTVKLYGGAAPATPPNALAMAWCPKQIPNSALPLACAARIVSQSGSIHGSSSVVLNREPGITKPSKSASICAGVGSSEASATRNWVPASRSAGAVRRGCGRRGQAAGLCAAAVSSAC